VTRRHNRLGRALRRQAELQKIFSKFEAGRDSVYMLLCVVEDSS